MALVRILVDGYSLLHGWPELAPREPRYSAAARDELVHVLRLYSDAVNTPVTVVFDGAGSVGTGWRELVPRITCPALLIIGDNSAGAIVGPPVVDELSRLHPPLQVAHIEGAGHNIRRDSFEAYMPTVERFFQEA